MLTRRSVLQKLACLAPVSVFALRPWSAMAQMPRELGVLTPFYRSTQLQGHLFGMGLMELPEYLLAPDVDLKYRKKPGATKEIPFVDSFTINRFLGGYREDWLHKFHLVDGGLGRRSLDYAIRRADGSLEFRPDLIRRRLQPYLDAGYRPEDITIALENVPWDLATLNGKPPEEGPWGRRTPPANLAEWEAVVRQFATDIKSYLGDAASTLHFETGVEYDEKVSFDASAPEFFGYYQATDRGLHSVLPNATLNPGEFTGMGTCTPAMRNCVYDTAAFLHYAVEHHLNIPDVPRSLHSFLQRPADVWPSATAQRAIASYRRLPPVGAEIHQFGLLGEPWGYEGGDPAAAQASWQFQVLVRLWQSIKPRRVFHWGGFQTVGRTAFLNGAGFLRLVLDRYLGTRAYLLDLRDAAPSGRAEVMAVGFAGGSRPAVIVSSFSPFAEERPRPVTVALPAALSGMATPPQAIRYRQSDNVYALMRADLAGANNLKSEFANCTSCLAGPQAMARDFERARPMMLNNTERYISAIKQHLRWRQGDPAVVRNGTTLQVKLEPNELAIIE